MKIKHEVQTSYSHKNNYHNPNYDLLNTVLIDNINSRVKRSDDDKSFIEATLEDNYRYLLSLEDITYIARLEYNNYQSSHLSNFEIVDSLSELKKSVDAFLIKTKFQNKIKKIIDDRLTLILYHTDNKHCITLVISCKENHYIGYYADSSAQSISSEYQAIFDEKQIRLIYLTEDFVQQKDAYNSALWALENAETINKLLNEDHPIDWCVNQLKQSREKNYFNMKRIELIDKLSLDPSWRELHADILKKLNSEFEKNLPFPSPSSPSSSLNKDEPANKRLKVVAEKDVKNLLGIFTESFLNTFTQRLAAYHIIAREERLTMQALKSELITGATGALFGMGISQSLMGNSMGIIPSMAASVRIFTGKFLIKKEMAQKIVKYFSKVENESLSTILIKTAVDIFYSFESQFTCVTDKAGDAVAMEKLADDAVDRTVNYLKTLNYDENILISNELLEKAVLIGPSETFFDPNLKIFKVQTKGKVILNDKIENIGNKIPINTGKLYEQVGLIFFDSNNRPSRMYVPKNHRQKYGYRRLLDWEKNENGDLNENSQNYIEDFFIPLEYEYVLTAEEKKTEADIILNKIKNRFTSQTENVLVKEKNKKPILFDLREPVVDFTGRKEILNDLHRILIKNSNIGVISSLATMSVSSLPSTSGLSGQGTSSGAKLSISGLGGIGKTQVALQYAKLYAQDYDNNVLWINAETKENIFFSFNKLAKKLQIETKDQYNQDKDLEEIVEAIYDYFSDRKSLFILDNVENYREIEAYLPKSMLGNKPIILITSRYTNWSNIATVFPLDVFTELETLELFKKSLTGNIQDRTINILNKILQGLPLALKQAIAYIKLRKESNSDFNTNDYIDLYKEKSHELLNFDFSEYSNDPYLKTVFTTFLITFDKIQSHPTYGKNAIEILYTIAYLDPENISNKLLYQLNLVDDTYDFFNFQSYIDGLVNLLKSYSMINLGHEADKYTVHRLVQQVLRINLEKDPIKFERIVKQTRTLVQHLNKEGDLYHYLHFFLYMLEHEQTKSIATFNNIESLFDKLSNQEIKHWFYVLDLALRQFPKEKYLKFLSDSLAYSTKKGFTYLVTETLSYFESELQLGQFSKEDIHNIFERIEFSFNTIYKLNKYSRVKDKKIQQHASLKLIYDMKVKIFGSYENYLTCSLEPSRKKRKRNICSNKEVNEKIETIKYEKARLHFDKVLNIINFVGSGLMAKNILTAISQNDWNEVAINLNLIMGSKISGELSSHLLTQGKKLETEAHLLKKDLGLENKKAGSFLFNKEVSLANKKLFLGKTLQLASSFVSRGTAIYSVYNLKKEITAYKMGDSELLPDIISNGVITSTMGIEIGVEISELLLTDIGISGIINPPLEAIAVLVWLGTDIYEAEEQISALQKYVHLSWKECYIEFVRGFFHYPPSNYLQAKANNEQLVLSAINFLKNHTDFSRYIAPSFSSNRTRYENNVILLNYKRSLIVENSVPEQPSEGHLFCLPGIPAEVNEEKGRSAYLCNHAFGVEYTLNRTGEITLIDLGSGNDTVIASNSPNYFVINNGKKKYIGGDKGNIFRLLGNTTTGQLIGGKSSDVLLIDPFFSEKSIFIDRNSYLCSKEEVLISLKSFPWELSPCPTFNRIDLNKINQIYGRKKQQDIIYLNSDIHIIDGYGGSNIEHPDLVFITEHSYENPSLVLRNNTLVLFSLNTTTHTMDYQLPANEIGKADIRVHFLKSLHHRFFFECDLDDILGMLIQNNTLTISVMAVNDIDVGSFTITISDSNKFNLESPQTKNVTDFEKNSSYFFNNMEIKLVNNEQIFIQEVTTSNKTIEEHINRFSLLANYLDKTITIQLQNNITLAIGREKYEIFYVDGMFPSHLVGNGGENLYLIMPKENISFPLATIILYDRSSNEADSDKLINTLDLRKVYKKIKKSCPNSVIYSNCFLEKNDLILTLMSNMRCYDVNTILYLVYIKFKNGVDWYQKMDILLESDIPKHIETTDGEEWVLNNSPLFFDNNKKIIVLTDKDIEENTEISLLRNNENYSFFREGADLIFTNMPINPLEVCTIVGRDYYQNPVMKKKLLSIKLDFFDEEFYLKNHQGLIDEAHDFSDLLKTLEKTEAAPKLPKGLSELRLKRHISIDSEVTILHESRRSWGVSPLNIAMGATAIMVLGGGLLRFYKRRQNAPAPLQMIVIATLALPALTHAQKQKIEATQLDWPSRFSIGSDCLIAETPMDWIGVCQNKDHILYLKTNQEVYSEYYFFESYQINNTYLDFINKGFWKHNLSRHSHIVNALPEEIYPLLPPHWQEQFNKKRMQQHILALWHQQALMTVIHYLGDGIILYTPVGNLFKALGLSLDWKIREDRYLLNRCLFALEQRLFFQSNSMFLFSISSELALLHPITQRAYTYLTYQEDFSKAKFVIRFVMDVLQLGLYNVYHLAHIFEYCFPKSESIKNIVLGLRIANYFYLLTNDLAYWHLGIALFLLPQLPTLLEYLGISATRGLQEFCNKLVNLFICQSLLHRLTEDEGRLEQRNQALSIADTRVGRARNRLTSFTTTIFSFFPNNVKNNQQDMGSTKYEVRNVL